MNHLDAVIFRSQFQIAKSVANMFSAQLPHVKFVEEKDSQESSSVIGSTDLAEFGDEVRRLSRRQLEDIELCVQSRSGKVIDYHYQEDAFSRMSRSLSDYYMRFPALEDGFPAAAVGADRVFCRYVIERCSANLVDVGRSLFRLLKRGGQIDLLSDNALSFSSIKNLHTKGLIQPGIYNEHSEKKLSPHMGVMRKYSIFELCMLMTRFGFRDIKVICRGPRSERELFSGYGIYLMQVAHVRAVRPTWDVV